MYRAARTTLKVLTAHVSALFSLLSMQWAPTPSELAALDVFFDKGAFGGGSMHRSYQHTKRKTLPIATCASHHHVVYPCVVQSIGRLHQSATHHNPFVTRPRSTTHMCVTLALCLGRQWACGDWHGRPLERQAGRHAYEQGLGAIRTAYWKVGV